MALQRIWSVYWPTEDRLGPDLDQMNRVVEVDEEIARMRLGDSTAREPSAEELAAYEEQHAIEQKADDALADGDLTSLKRDELLELLTDEQRAELPPRATKADIASLIEDSRAQQSGTQDVPGVVSQPTVVTDLTDPHRLDGQAEPQGDEVG